MFSNVFRFRLYNLTEVKYTMLEVIDTIWIPVTREMKSSLDSQIFKSIAITSSLCNSGVKVLGCNSENFVVYCEVFR